MFPSNYCYQKSKKSLKTHIFGPENRQMTFAVTILAAGFMLIHINC